MAAPARGAKGPRRTPAATTPPKQDPDVVFVDLNDLTAAEYEAVEEMSGLPIGRAMDVEKPSGAIQRAMGWAVKVRTDPEFPFEDSECGRGNRPRCGDCHCSRRLKVFVTMSEAPVPPSGGNGS